MSRWCCYWWWCCNYCGNPNNGSTGGSSTGFGITSGISALLSVLVVTGAISTGEWLLTEEKLPKSPSANNTAEPDSKLTYSGLWKVCIATSKYLCFITTKKFCPAPLGRAIRLSCFTLSLVCSSHTFKIFSYGYKL